MGSVFPTARARLFTAVSAVALFTVLAGCDGSDKKQSSADHYQKAADYYAKGDVAAALIETKNALQADDKNGKAHLLRAQLLLESADNGGAEDEFRAAKANGVPPADWFTPLGRTLLLQEKFPKVRELITQTASTEPAIQAEGKALMASVALASNDGDGALKGYQDALAIDGQNLDALLGMVMITARKPDLDKATEYLAKAKAVAPHSPEVYRMEAGIDGARHDAAAAEAALRQASAEAPASPIYRLLLAETLVNDQKNDEAQQLLDAILKRSPDLPLANHLRAVLLYRQGKFKEADDIETAVLSKAPDLHVAQFLDGLAKYPLGQYAQAEHLLNGVDVSGPSADAAAMVRGASLLRLGRIQEGYAILKPLQDKMDKDPNFLLLTAEAARVSKDLPTSLALYQRALNGDPKNPAILTKLASVQLDMGDINAGKTTLNQAIDLGPADAQTRDEMFQTLLKGKEFDKAMAMAVKEQGDEPTKAMGWVMGGMTQALQGKTDEAIQNFTKALQVDPTATDAITDLAGLYLTQGRIDLARTTVEDGYKRVPKNVQICAMGSKVESAAKNPAGMQTWLERYLELDPKNSEARAVLVDALLQQRQPQQALAVALTGLQQTPGDARALRALGQAYLATNQPENSAATLRDLVAKEPSGENYYLLSQAYIQLHDETRLRGTLEQVTQKFPDFRPGRLLLARVMIDQKDVSAKTDALLTQLAAEKADDPEVVELQARAANVKGGPKAAIPILQKFMTTSKTEPRNLVMVLASAQWEASQQDAAMKTLGDWAKAHPDDGPARMTLATRQIQAKHYDDAHKTLAEEIRVNPSDWIAQNNLAWVLMTKGDLVGAQAQIDSAHKIAGTQPDVLDTEGQIALARGDASHAVDLLKLATLNGSPAPSIRIHLARALIASGKPAEAVDTLKSVVTTSRTGPDADEAKALLATIKN